MFALIRYFLLFLAGILLLRLVFHKLLGGAARQGSRQTRSAGRRSDSRPRTIAGTMIRDPQCGMHVAQNLAISARSQGRRIFFCSERCRDAYLQGLKPTGTDA